MGFIFNGKHSDTFNMGVISVERVLKSAKRVYQTVIGGKDGTHDFTDNTYSNFLFNITCDYLDTDFETWKDNVALWLSVAGELVFDKTPSKIYLANLYSDIPTTQLYYQNQFTLSFECFPFAMSLPNQANDIITDQGQEIPLQVGGTARTPCTIIIKNIGDTPITNLRLTHRKEV